MGNSASVSSSSAQNSSSNISPPGASPQQSSRKTTPTSSSSSAPSVPSKESKSIENQINRHSNPMATDKSKSSFNLPQNSKDQTVLPFPLPHNPKLYSIVKQNELIKPLDLQTFQHVIKSYKKCILRLHPEGQRKTYNNNNQESFSSETSDHSIEIDYDDLDDEINEDDEECIDEDDDHAAQNQHDMKSLQVLFQVKSKEENPTDGESKSATINIPTWAMLGFDRANFIKYIVSPHIIPPGGVLDCFFYAFSSPTPNHNTPTSQQTAKPSLIFVSDLIFLLQILYNGSKIQKQQLLFSVYNSYQKSGTISKDTIRRFISAVYGNEVLETQTYVKTLLDNDVINHKKELTLKDFISYQNEIDVKENILIDWLQTFARSWISAYLDSDFKSPLSYLIIPHNIKKNQANDTDKNLLLKRKEEKQLHHLCKYYKLPKVNMFEVRRKFHTICQMQNNHTSSSSSTNNTGLDIEFLSDYLEKEGFLSSIFTLEFLSKKKVWYLKDILEFGCMFVRNVKNDVDIYHWFFHSLVNKQKIEDDTELMEKEELIKMIHWIVCHYRFRKENDMPLSSSSSESYTITVNNNQSVFEFTRWKESNQSTTQQRTKQGNETSPSDENGMIKVSLAKELGFLMEENTAEYKQDEFISYQNIAKSLLQHSHRLTLEQFTNYLIANTPNLLSPILLDLQLISAIVFGIPPSHSSLEFKLVQELVNRYRSKFPHSHASRRGPSGTVWYILSSTWWKKWCLYAGSSNNTGTTSNHQHPGHIDNHKLLREGSLALKSSLKLRNDFELVPPMVWYALQAWHDGGPPISRTVVQRRSSSSPNSEIELYPLFLTISLLDSTQSQTIRPFQQSVPVSKLSPLGFLISNLINSISKQKLSATEGGSIIRDARLWRQKDWFLLDLNASVQDQSQGNHGISLEDGDMLVLEIKMENGDWVRNTSNNKDVKAQKGKLQSSESGRFSGSFGAGDKKGMMNGQHGPILGDGIVGLYNMGNTCYLNSSIQCLSHTPLLREYFTSKSYLRDVNTTNPMGYQGRLAQICAVLVHQLWKFHGNHTTSSLSNPSLPKSVNQNPEPLNVPSLTPKSFKDALSKFSEHFAGNEQHDAQELLSFLLAGLSEDLNLINERIYIEQPDSDGRPNKELADIWWRNHLRREMSIIVALFSGQYKSVLNCKVCKYESARFEPFTYLQLPLPEDDYVTLNIIYIPIQGSILRYSIKVTMDGNIFDCLKALAKISSRSASLSMSEDEKKTADNQEEDLENNKCEEGDEGRKEDGESDRHLEEEGQYEEKAQDMAVVDIRDSKILSITPTNRSISQIQSRDTGDVPLLYVYELDSVPEKKNPKQHSIKDQEAETEKKLNSSRETVDEDSVQKNEVDTSSDSPPSDSTKKITSNPIPILPQSKPSYIAIAQRKLESLSPKPYLFPYCMRAFGSPLLLRIADLEGYTGKDIYDLIAKRIGRFVKSGEGDYFENFAALIEKENEKSMETTTESSIIDGKAYSSISKTSPSVTNISRRQIFNRRAGAGQNQQNGKNNLNGQASLQSPKTTIDMRTVIAGTFPRYGFRLRLATRDGKRCSLCPWYECCIGCVIPDDDYPTLVQDGDTVALDWHRSMFSLKDAAHCDLLCKSSESSGTSFSSISNNNGNNNPPFFEDILKHQSFKENNHGFGNSISLEECLDAFAKEEKIPEAYCSKCKDFRVSTKRMSLWRLPPIMVIHLKRFQFTQHMKRKLRNLVVFPTEGLDLSRIVAQESLEGQCIRASESETGSESSKDECEKDLDEENGDNGEQQVKMPKSQSTSSLYDMSSESLYDLYAVIHHQGALSGGHYVASLRSEIDGKWRLFNDAQVYDISSKEIVDATAYILFYIRRDVKKVSLADFWDSASRDEVLNAVGAASRDRVGVKEEDIDKLVKHRERCVIS